MKFLRGVPHFLDPQMDNGLNGQHAPNKVRPPHREFDLPAVCTATQRDLQPELAVTAEISGVRRYSTGVRWQIQG